jgi:hypothetical protein
MSKLIFIVLAAAIASANTATAYSNVVAGEHAVVQTVSAKQPAKLVPAKPAHWPKHK